MIRKFISIFVLGLGFVVSTIAGADAQTLKIGVIAPLTGAGAAWGMAMAEGAKILAAETNAKGGLDVGGKKHQVEIIAYDDQYKAADAVAAYNRLVNQDRAKFLLVLTSPSSLALKQNIEDDKILTVSSGYSAKILDANSKYMFRMFSVAQNYLPPFVAWMKDNIKERRIVIVNPNDETGWDQGQLDERLLKQNSFEVLGNELYERSQKDFQPLLTKILAMKPELINLSSTAPATAVLIIRQARELGYKGRFVKTAGGGPKEILEAIDAKDVEGMITILFVDLANPGYRRLADAYKKSVGQEPDEIIVPYYDGARVLLQAIHKAGDINDTSKVAAAFAKALPMDSTQGDTMTLGNQQILTTIYVANVKNGKAVVIGKAN